jgi:adenosylhomocysteine nucleosidase
MKLIGLIAAMNQESNALLRLIGAKKKITLGKFLGYNFNLDHLECVLITSGMGMKRAAEAAQILGKVYAPDALISFGIAGAVETELDIGDVVVARATCKLRGSIPGQVIPLAIWREAAREAMSKALAAQGKHIWTGTAVTTRGSQVGTDQLKDLLHPILEMETAGIAQAAAERNLPVFALRAISDGPNSPLPFDLAKVMDENANLKLGYLAREMLSHPRYGLKFSQLVKNSALAAHTAALALVAGLSNMEL